MGDRTIADQILARLEDFTQALERGEPIVQKQFDIMAMVERTQKEIAQLREALRSVEAECDSAVEMFEKKRYTPEERQELSEGSFRFIRIICRDASRGLSVTPPA